MSSPGRDITGSAGRTGSPASGLARTFQRVRLFGGLSVLENVMVAAMSVGARRAEATGRAEAALARWGSSCWAGHARRPRCPTATSAWSRSPGRWRCGRAFLFLDEPAAGLNEDESEELLARLARDPGRESASAC